jgi:1,4-alpha-glucan branching enzyme
MTGALRTREDILFDAVASGASDDPFAVLGRHQATLGGKPALVIRTMQPAASGVDLVTPRQTVPMERRRREGLFEVTVPFDGGDPGTFEYRLRIHEATGFREIRDPYQYGEVLTDFDLHLLSEGTHYRAWERLGARRVTVGVVTGVHFAVWAPNAQRVSVIGDFNGWDGRVHSMRKLVPSGIWEIFIPDLEDGACYKYEVRTTAGHLLDKADPYARYFEVPPLTASIVWSDGTYQWADGDWIRDRASRGGWFDRPMSVYEVHLGSWRRVPEDGQRYLTYRELAESLVPYVREMGFTHIELMPVMEHPFAG